MTKNNKYPAWLRRPASGYGWRLLTILTVGLSLIRLSSLHITTEVNDTRAANIITQPTGPAIPARKGVLLLFPYQFDLPVNTLAVQAFQEEFGNVDDFALDLYYEYPDLNRFSDPRYQQKLFDLYATKYDLAQIDLVIVQNEAMLNLWLEHRDKILPDTPVVFYDITTDQIAGRQLPPGVVGVSAIVDYTPSVKWMLQTNPAVNEIVIVQGVGEADHGFSRPVEALMQKMAGQVKFTNLSDLPLAEIKERGAALPPSAVVLYHLMFEDVTGTTYRPIDVLEELSAVSAVPIISGYDQFIGTGTIGGNMYSIEQQARQATQLGLHILRGQAIANIPSDTDKSNHFIFDHQALQRYQIPLSDLPPGSIIKNRQYSVWELYRPQIIDIAAGFMGLSLLVVFLVISTRRLNRARLALSRFNLNLESQVQEHTAALRQANHSLAQEIAAHKQAEDALRESERSYRHQFANNSAAMLLIDLTEGAIIDANTAALEFYGYPPEQMRAMQLADLAIQAASANRQPTESILPAAGQRFEAQHRRADGSVRVVEVSSSQIQFEQRPVLHLIIYDITDRKQAEAALRQSEARLQRAENVARFGHWELHLSERVITASAGARAIYGLAGDNWSQAEAQSLALPEYRAELDAALAGLIENNRPYNVEFRIRRPNDGELRDIHSIAEYDPVKRVIFGVISDVTDRKQVETTRRQLEVQQRQIQKAESLGRMAGAIAHHFNNQLQAVMGHIELAMLRVPEPQAQGEHLLQALSVAEKSAEMSRMMLVYLGQTPDLLEPLDLAETCHRSLAELRETLPPDVTLKVDMPASRPVINGNPTRLRQLLTHLVTNAREAIGNGSGIIDLTITTVSAADIPTRARFPLEWQPQDRPYACLAVRDNGSGIAAPNIEKLFDPFYSTKFTGRGLGLAIVMGILRSHSGLITVDSQPGQGSTFRLFFPMTDQARPRHPQPEVDAPEMTGEATVLLVDDDKGVVDIARQMLDQLGYTVLVAADGIEAVEQFRRHQNSIDCVLCDLTMPRMDGWETLAALRELSPELPVILSSGYDEAEVMAGHHLERPPAFLSKPYQLNKINQTIRRVLTARKAHI